MEALSYSILHIAKMNACATPEAFQVTFEKTTIKPDFAEAFFGAIKGSIQEMRDILQRENERGHINFKEMHWRLGLVTGCRQRQKMMQPKYTVRLDTEQKPIRQSASDTTDQQRPQLNQIVFDVDFTNMQRLEEELRAAVKSVAGEYPRKVQKFIR